MKTHGVAFSPCANGRGGKAAPVGATATLQKSRPDRRQPPQQLGSFPTRHSDLATQKSTP